MSLQPLTVPTNDRWLESALYLVALFFVSWTVAFVLIQILDLKKQVGVHVALIACHGWAAVICGAVVVACLGYVMVSRRPPAYDLLRDPLAHYVALVILLGPVSVLLGRSLARAIHAVEERLS